jgi:hypothetical protein
MDAIGSIGTFMAQTAAPLAAAAAASSSGVSDATPGSGGLSSASAAQFSSDYAMSLLAKVTHASADQALAHIQSIATPNSPIR